MSRPSRLASLPIVILLAGLALPPCAAATIFKCRSAGGHWSYADRPQAGCRGHWTILHPSPPTPRAHVIARTPPPRRPPPVARRVVERRLRGWQAALRALRATRVPRDQTLARWRARALQLVVADIERLHRALSLQGGVHPP